MPTTASTNLSGRNFAGPPLEVYDVQGARKPGTQLFDFPRFRVHSDLIGFALHRRISSASRVSASPWVTNSRALSISPLRR